MVFGKLRKKLEQRRTSNWANGCDAEQLSGVALRNSRVLAQTSFLDSDGEIAGVLRAFPTMLELETGSDGNVAIEWSDFASARWNSDVREMRFSFVDPQLPELVFRLAVDYNELFLTAVRERIERSVVFQSSQILPSGVIVSGQVRRNADDSLFVQVLTDGEPSNEDTAAMTLFESELRQVVGL